MHTPGIVRTLLVLLMASTLCLLLPGCGGSGSSGSDNDQDRSTQTEPDSGEPDPEPSDPSQPEPSEPEPGEEPELRLHPSIQFIETDRGLVGPGRIVDGTVRFVGVANPYDSILLMVNGTPSGSVLADANGDWELDFTRVELIPGEYELTARAITSDGETLESRQPFVFTFDPTLPPVPQITGISDDTGAFADGVTSNPNQTLSGTAEAGLLVRVLVNESPVGETIADELGNWQFDLGVVDAVQGDGLYQLTAVSEELGQESPLSEPFQMTLDQTPPSQVALQPGPNSVGVPQGVDLRIEFNEPVLAGTGQISLHRRSDNGQVVGIGVTSLDLPEAGSQQIVVPLAALLNFATGYYVEVPAGAFQDLAGNPSTSIQGDEWAFNVERPSFPPVDIGSLTPQQGFRVQATQSQTARSQLGQAVAGVGDLNGDGFEDFVIAEPGFDADRGAAYVLWGRAGLNRADLSTADWSAAEGILILGAGVGDRLGEAVAAAGDMNGDGIDDLMLAAPGSDLGAADAGTVYVVWGRASLTDLNLAAWDGSAGFRILARDAGQELGDAALPELGLPANGQSVSAVGDYNGDGFSDLVLGHSRSDRTGTNSGAAYVILGRAGASRSDVDLALPGADGFVVEAGNRNQWLLGYSVLMAGDLNRDGLDDVAVSAVTADAAAAQGGAVFVLYGRPGTNPGNVDVTALSADTGVAWVSAEAGSLLGAALGSGEFNGDGITDLYLGQPGYAPAGAQYGAQEGAQETENTGAVHILFGGKNWSLMNDIESMNSVQGFTLTGSGAGSYTGQAVANAGDINADGLDDLVIGAYNGAFTGVRSGRAWIVLGSDDDVIDSWQLADFLESDGIPLRGSSAGDRLGQAVSAADHNGDGFSDVMLGAPGSADNNSLAAVVWGNDWLGDVVFRVGQAGADNIVGSEVAETLTGNGGYDAFSAGAGDDRIEIADTDVFRVQGGTGEDTLALVGNNVSLDLSTVPGELIKSIEVIDLGDSNNQLKVDRASVLRISPSTNTLRITGGTSDLFQGSISDNWTVVEELTLAGVDYVRYADGEAELLVQANVTQPGVERLLSSQRYFFDTTSDGVDVMGDVDQFPLLLRISDPAIIDAVQPGAPDIRFVDSDGTTRLPYEIERWDQNTDSALVWVLVPQLEGNSDSDFITLLYDDAVDGSVEDGQDPATLWNDYVGVWHYEQSGRAWDSSPFANHGVSEGWVGRAESFVGRSAVFTDEAAYRVPYNDSLAIDGAAFSVEAWYSSNTCSTTLLSRPDLSVLGRGDSVSGFWQLNSAHYVASIIVVGTRVDRASFTVGGSGGSSTLSGGALFGLFIGDCVEHVVASYDPLLGSSIYINGIPKYTDSRRYSLTSDGDLILGGHDTRYRLTLDETRVARRLWDADRVRLSYQNQRRDSRLVVPE